MGQESFNLGFSHGAWVGFVVEKDEATDPVDVLFFGFVSVMFNAQRIPDFIEQFLLFMRHDSFPLVVNEMKMRYSKIRISDMVTSLDIPLFFTFCM